MTPKSPGLSHFSEVLGSPLGALGAEACQGQGQAAVSAKLKRKNPGLPSKTQGVFIFWVSLRLSPQI